MEIERVIAEYETNLEKVLRLACENLSDEELAKNLSELLKITTSNLTAKWRSGRKVVRTVFALKTLPNYPDAYLKTSLFIDATVNILDDILDELMEKEERALNIIELIKVLTLLFAEDLPQRIMTSLSSYFSKILCIASSEMHYGERIKSSSDPDEILHNSIMCYNYRVLDIDIFFEIPMIVLYGRADPDLLTMARIFRAVNLIVKDYHDITVTKKKIERIWTGMLETCWTITVPKLLTLWTGRKTIGGKLWRGLSSYLRKMWHLIFMKANDPEKLDFTL
jgi:hypothetical protein